MFTRAFALLLPVLIACSRSTTVDSSREPAPAAGGENDEAARRTLGQLEDDWAKAVEAHDTAFLARVIAPDFHGTQDSTTFGRAEVIRNVADSGTQLREMKDNGREIRIYGNGTVGVVTSRASWKTEKGEHPGEYSNRYTETWVKRDGRWQVVAGHYSAEIPMTASQP
jgi:ketosteroid isomerase-like protein